MTAKLINKKFTPRQFEYKVSNEYGEFSYYWAFCSYERGEGYVKLVLNIDLEGYTEDSLSDFKNYLDYPNLAKVVESIVKDYDGVILTDNPASFGFAFCKKDKMFEFISDVAKRMNYEGIGPFNGIDRCSAFPSVEYATDMLTYLFNEDCSLPEVEDHMLASAGMTGTYDEICGFTELPCTSEQKFDLMKDTDVSDFFKKWDEYLVEFQKTHEESSVPSKLNREIKRIQKNNKPDVNTTEEVSREYTSFSSLWM